MSNEAKRRVAPSEKILLDAGEAAEMLSISKPTLYRLMQIEDLHLLDLFWESGGGH